MGRKWIDILDAELRELYLARKWSAPKIAEYLGCSSTEIYRCLHASGISVRQLSDAKRVRDGLPDIPESELRYLYLERKWSAAEIAKYYGCEPETIRQRLYAFAIPMRSRSKAQLVHAGTDRERHDFSGDLRAKAYFIGFRLGDLTAMKRHPNSELIEVRCTSTRPEQITLIRELFAPYGHILVTQNILKSGMHKGTLRQHIQCSLNGTFEFLLDKSNHIPAWILEDDKLFLPFFAGYTDAEGSFYIEKARVPLGVFKISSYDKHILAHSRERLVRLGVRCSTLLLKTRAGYVDKRGIITRKDVWQFQVKAKEELSRLIQLLSPYLKHAERRRDMEQVKENVEWRQSEAFREAAKQRRAEGRKRETKG